MKKISSHEIALSALSCALSTILLVVGANSQLLLFTGYLFGGIALMLPLAKNSYRGYALAYGGTCILSLILSANKLDLLPFAMFFGLHPLVNELQLKTKINRWVACFAKALWFDGTMYLIARFIFAVTTDLPFAEQYFLPILLVFCTAFFVFYDYAMYRWRAVVNVTVARITGKK
jgi:hypothetical protein